MYVLIDLLQLDFDGKYTDAIELCRYHTVLTSTSQNGKAFTYDDQLASSDSNPFVERGKLHLCVLPARRPASTVCVVSGVPREWRAGL